MLGFVTVRVNQSTFSQSVLAKGDAFMSLLLAPYLTVDRSDAPFVAPGIG